MRDEKGITLAALVLTVIVLLILASIAVYSGTSTVKYAGYNKAKNEMQIMQATVNEWYEEYSNIEVADEEITEGKTKEQVKLEKFLGNENKYGVAATEESDSSYQTALNKTVNATGIIASDFLFLSEDYMKNSLGLDGSFEFLVNIPERTVILFNGYSYNGKAYYTTDDFGILSVGSNEFSGITFNLAQGDNTDVIISDLKLTDASGNQSDISKFVVQYKKTSDSNWNDVTTSVTKFIDEADHNKVKYKFTTPAITDPSILNIEYFVKILTIDKKIASDENHRIKVESDEYVRTGLILHLDGINNTGNGHSSTTTTWKDLSNTGNDAILNNIPETSTEDSGWGENYLALNGIDDYVSVDRTTNGDFTIEFLAKNIEVINNREYGSLFMINNWASNAIIPTIQLFSDERSDSGNKGKIYYRILVPADEENTTYAERSYNTYTEHSASYIISKRDGKIKLYKNGQIHQEDDNNVFINRINMQNMNIEIGRWYHTSNSYVKEKVNAMRIYNCALTDEEVAHNYRVDKLRFGL